MNKEVNQKMSQQQILTLIVDAASHDDLVDTLMGLESITGFTQSSVNGFSHAHAQFDIAEQVAGHRELFRFDVQHEAPQLERLLATIKELRTANGIHYWVTPVLASGKL